MCILSVNVMSKCVCSTCVNVHVRMKNMKETERETETKITPKYKIIAAFRFPYLARFFPYSAAMMTRDGEGENKEIRRYVCV